MYTYVVLVCVCTDVSLWLCLYCVYVSVCVCTVWRYLYNTQMHAKRNHIQKWKQLPFLRSVLIIIFSTSLCVGRRVMCIARILCVRMCVEIWGVLAHTYSLFELPLINGTTFLFASPCPLSPLFLTPGTAHTYSIFHVYNTWAEKP